MPIALLALMIIASLSLTGCYKRYQTEHSYVVLPYQTAYLVPKEGDAAKQGKLNSVEAYEACKVASKRIIIPTRWNKLGRGPGNGEWIETMELVVVNRTPVALHWTAQAETGTSINNEAIWMESKDSIALSIPIAMTAYIQEIDASSYLFWYNRNQLFNVLNTEGRNKIMEVCAEFSNSLDLQDLTTRYEDINIRVREVVIDYFAQRGITITSLGIAGYAQYRDDDPKNPKSIANSIDAVFAAQQTKAVELAKATVAEKHKAVMEAMGQAEAIKAQEASRGPMIAEQKISDAEKTAAGMIGEAKGNAIISVNDVVKEASSSPTFLKIMALDVESQRIEQWNGDSPVVVSGPNDFTPANNSNGK